MNQKNLLTLDNEFLKYCLINKIEDPVKFAEKVFNKGFTIIKYGETPIGFKNEKIVEKEIVVEKEVIVEKIVETTNNEEIQKLIGENIKLKKDLETITMSLEGIRRKGTFMKDSNLTSLYDE
jgi:hypothetical protein